MHRSNFRPRPSSNGKKSQPVRTEPEALRSPIEDKQELNSLKEQIVNISQSLVPMKAAIDTLVEIEKQDNVAVPKDMAKSLHMMHERMDRIELRQEKAFKQAQKVESTFSGTLLELINKVEKVSGGKDSKFSLAHSMESLIDTLDNQKYRIIRDKNGDMVGVETA